MNDQVQQHKNETKQATHHENALLRLVKGRFEKLKSDVKSLPQRVHGMMEPVRVARRQHKDTEKRESRRRFPESNVWFVQLLLLLLGLIPWVAGFVATLLWPLRRWLAQTYEKLRARVVNSRAKRGGLAVAAVCVAVLAVVFSRFDVATTVSYRGEKLGRVVNEEVVNTAYEEISAAVKTITGEETSVRREDFEVTKGLTSLSNYLDVDDLEKVVYKDLGVVTYGYTLYVNGEKIGSTVYEGALEDLLAQIQSSHYTENTVSCDFIEEVEIVPGMVAVDDVVNLGTILEIVNSTKAGEVTHTVKSGEVWSKIARDNGMDNAQLLALNPGYDINRLSIGDVLTISNAVPYLTVAQVERESYVAEIPYNIEYKADNTMYQGEYKVLSPGVPGSADVVADVTYVNGVEQDRVIISSETISEPVTELQAQGTVPRPSWYPTGTFRWPVSGRISSYFGSRYIFGSYSYHNAIDIVCSYGVPIVASDGGTVIFSGYSGSYGYLVKIDHHNGYVTYYAHNSSLLVSKGDKVYKGQQIAKAGSTGRSTGVHCHFGIEYKGSFINPLNKLP